MSVDYMRGVVFVRTIGAETKDDYCEDCLGYLQWQQELEGDRHYDKLDRVVVSCLFVVWTKDR